MQKRIYVSLLISLVFVFVSVTGASAQEMPPPKENSGVELTDELLDKVVNAYVQIIKINENLQKSLQTAKDQKERMQLQEEANNNMVEAIQSSGLEVETYNEAMQQINMDKSQSKKFVERVERKMGGKKE
ncbi:MAG: DUF4168 domain-containing protein [Chitinispirillaceae bacterium]